MGIMSLAEIMDRSIDVLKKYIKTIVLFNLSFGIIFFISAIILFVVSSIFIGIFAALIVTNETLTGTIVAIILSTIVVIFITSFYFTSNIGMIKISSQEFINERIYTSKAIGYSFKSIFKVFGIISVGFLLFLPIVAIFVGIVYLFYRGFANSMILSNVYRTREIILIILSVLVLLAAIAVSTAYTTLLFFSLHAASIENKGVFSSLKRSYQLVKEDFWKVYGSIILFSLTILAITYSLEGLIDLILSILYLILKFFNFQQDYITFITVVLSLVRWPLTILSWLVISPLGLIMITLLYFNLRFKKEGYDISIRLKELQKNDERKQLSDIVEYNEPY